MRSDARKRDSSPISMHSDAHNGLTEAEREELLFAMCAPDPDRAPVTEVQMLYLTSAVARIKAAAVQAERERLAQEIEVAYISAAPDHEPEYEDGYWAGTVAAARITRGEGR